MLPTLSHHEIWYHRHKGVLVEVKRFTRGFSPPLGEFGWRYYITITDTQLAPPQFESLWLVKDRDVKIGGRTYPFYNERSAPFANVHWHVGVTFYEKTLVVDTNYRHVKIGCDFSHYWNDGKEYTLEDVLTEAIRTVDELDALLNFLPS